MQALDGYRSTFVHLAEYSLKTNRQIGLALLAIACGTFGLPYLFPVKPSISLSYEAGFNNHVAFVCFVAGCLLFALFWRRDIQVADVEDSPLRRTALYKTLGLTLAICLLRPGFVANVITGNEITYLLNRQDLLSRGLVPYRQFEFAYGPLLLYPEMWIARLLHVTQTTGYYLWWTASWLIGMWMMWEVVRSVDIATHRRTQIYVVFVALMLQAIPTEGLNYTPARLVMGAFIVVGVYRVCWHWLNPVWTSAAAVAGIALAVAVSPEQGFGAAAGLVIYLGYLTVRRNPAFSRSAMAVMLVGFIAIFVTADHFSMLATMRSFSNGGNSFPLLPTPIVCLVLVPFIGATCVLVQRLREGNEESVTLPLVFAGAALLPSAMGRCDVGHLLWLAWPAMVVGIFAIYAFLPVSRWWIPIALVFLLVPATYTTANMLKRTSRDASEFVLFEHGGQSTALQRFLWTHLARKPSLRRYMIATSAALTSKVSDSYPGLPCDRIYLAPSYGRMLGPCMDDGYFLGQANLFLPAQIQQKIDELTAHPNAPLLLAGTSLETAFLRSDNMDMLYGIEGAYFVPVQRHAPLSLAPLVSYISEHYVRTKTLDNDEYSIWEPKAVQGGSAAGGSGGSK